MKKQKIYVASSWKNVEQQKIVEILRKLGHEVYDFKNPAPNNKGFSWSQLNINRPVPQWTNKEYLEALEQRRSIEAFNLDFNAMQNCTMCLLVLPSGRSAHLEAGWFIGKDKLVFIYQPELDEPELMYKMSHGIITSPYELGSLFKIDKED